MNYTLYIAKRGLPILFAAIALVHASFAEDEPPLLFERSTPTPSFDAEAISQNEQGKRRYARYRDHRKFPDMNSAAAHEEKRDPDAAIITQDSDDKSSTEEKRFVDKSEFTDENPAASAQSVVEEKAKKPVQTVDLCSQCEKPHPGVECYEAEYYEEVPTPEGVEAYRQKLAARLYERYNNSPQHAGKVGKVSVVISKPLETSLDGRFILAEFDQLVYDIWGRRIPALEKEYYVVTFGTGGAAEVRTDPSVRVGLDLHGSYSELAPLGADPFSRISDPVARPEAAQPGMPGWWRPEFPELR